MTTPTHDHAVSRAFEETQEFEQALREFLDAHPDAERKDAWAPFSAAWHARVRVARQRIGRYSELPHEAMVLHIIEKLEDHVRHLDKLVFGGWRAHRALTRDVESLRHMLREKNLDPRDAPAWRRISEQRKEIRRLIKENDRLRGYLARTEGEKNHA